MRDLAKNIRLPSIDDLFSTEEERQDAKLEKIQILPLSELHPFEGHPFQVRDDEEMDKMVDNHKEVLTPDVRSRRLEELSARMRTVRRELNTCADIETDAAAVQLKWQEVRQAEKEEREVNENEQRRRSR